MNHRFADKAYERAIWDWLRRKLEEECLAGGGTKKTPILCDALPVELREVPQGAIAQVVMRLEKQSHDLSMEMSEYDFVLRRQAPIGALPPAPQDLEEANEGG